MPVVPSPFDPPALLRNGHAQTLLGVWVRRAAPVMPERERLELDDGDFLDLGWLRAGYDRLAILSHGLEGRLDNGYIGATAAALAGAGWDALAWNYRGCGEEANRLARFYHSGETKDLREVVRHAAQRYSTIALVGFSLGGNLILKYLGEAPPHPSVRAAVAVSAPVDLAASARKLDTRWDNRIYLRRFLQTLVAKVEAKALRFPEAIDPAGSRAIRTFREFDDRYTARLHGFRDAEDYWKQSSARQFLPRITVPALLLNACDDPFLAPGCFPFEEAEASGCVHLEAPAAGGHLGFIGRGMKSWVEGRVVEFLDGAV